MYIVIVAPADDLHALAVAKRIREISKERISVLFFDIGTFPFRTSASITITQQGSNTEFAIGQALPELFSLSNLFGEKCIEQIDVSRELIRAIWWRRPRSPFSLYEESTYVNRFVKKNSLALIEACFSDWSLGPIIVNSPSAEKAIANKPYQLQAAKAHNLMVPNTIITNSCKQAESFVTKYISIGKRVIRKPLCVADRRLVPTRFVHSTDFADPQALQDCPVIFQEYIQGLFEVRLTVIGDQFFCMAQSAIDEVASPDIRLNRERTDLKVIDIPHQIRERVSRFQSAVGLKFGAYDFIVDSFGEWYFLEVNPSGQWLFVEVSTGQPIAASLASYLLKYCDFDEAMLDTQSKPFDNDELSRLFDLYSDKSVIGRALNLKT
jgi:hypothetical protein